MKVPTDKGDVEGVVNDRVVTFKGIPYAAPPVKNLRWQRPPPAMPWSGVRRCDKFGKSCIQPRFDEMDGTELVGEQSEDCLYLNVWATGGGTTARKPAMVWIHGGGFQISDGIASAYDGTQLALKGAVVVTFNYRLGHLGFFAHPALERETRGTRELRPARPDQGAEVGEEQHRRVRRRPRQRDDLRAVGRRRERADAVRVAGGAKPVRYYFSYVPVMLRPVWLHDVPHGGELVFPFDSGSRKRLQETRLELYATMYPDFVKWIGIERSELQFRGRPPRGGTTASDAVPSQGSAWTAHDGSRRGGALRQLAHAGLKLIGRALHRLLHPVASGAPRWLASRPRPYGCLAPASICALGACKVLAAHTRFLTSSGFARFSPAMIRGDRRGRARWSSLAQWLSAPWFAASLADAASPGQPSVAHAW